VSESSFHILQSLWEVKICSFVALYWIKLCSKKYYHRVGCSFIFCLDSRHLMAYLKKKQIHFLTAQNQETESSITERQMRMLWSQSGDTSLSKTPKDTSTCFQVFTILQCNISSQHKTKSSPTAITQPTRDCAPNRSSLSNGLVQLASRYKKILLPPLHFFSQRKCFCFRMFLESSFKSVVTSPQTNCCFKSVWSYFISLKSTR